MNLARSKALPASLIVVSTGQNEVAKTLNQYARSFVLSLPRKEGRAAIHLGPPKSVTLRVQEELRRQSEASFFFFGHGLTPPALGFVGHDRKPVVDRKTLRLLSGRRVGATCCYGNRLGNVASTNGFSLFGYTDELIVPLWRKHIKLLEAAFLVGPALLAAGQPVAKAADVAANEFRRLAQLLQRTKREDDRVIGRLILLNADKVRAWSKENGRKDQARCEQNPRQSGSSVGNVGQRDAPGKAKTSRRRYRIGGGPDTVT